VEQATTGASTGRAEAEVPGRQNCSTAQEIPRIKIRYKRGDGSTCRRDRTYKTAGKVATSILRVRFLHSVSKNLP